MYDGISSKEEWVDAAKDERKQLRATAAAIAKGLKPEAVKQQAGTGRAQQKQAMDDDDDEELEDSGDGDGDKEGDGSGDGDDDDEDKEGQEPSVGRKRKQAPAAKKPAAKKPATAAAKVRLLQRL
jgi:hypothetical protein